MCVSPLFRESEQFDFHIAISVNRAFSIGTRQIHPIANVYESGLTVRRVFNNAVDVNIKRRIVNAIERKTAVDTE